MTRLRSSLRAPALALALVPLLATAVLAWDPLPVADDPLIRMPGSQSGDLADVESPSQCDSCHLFDAVTSPVRQWKGSMMAQAARDPLFLATFTVAAQDSIWAIGRPNATDICIRCHFPEGWVEGRSDPTNGSSLTDSDWDGVHCGTCHRMMDPFFESTDDGSREGSDWAGYWDESGLGEIPSATSAAATYAVDDAAASTFALFDGESHYDGGNLPRNLAWTEAAGGQMFFSPDPTRRGPFADPGANHATAYSRFHKSRFFCATCHDVSNPVLANLAFAGLEPGDGSTRLPSEVASASSYFHVERTFSEFMLSDFGVGDGAAGRGAFAPDVFDTSKPGNAIGSCQDCHMPDRAGKACNKTQAVLRPADSVEHPQSGAPEHDLTGGNVWVPTILASAIAGSPNYDATNAALLGAGPATLTLDLGAGLGINPVLLLAGADRSLANLGNAASIEGLAYDPATGDLRFRVRNDTGHKLPSGYPEGRRIWVEVEVLDGGTPLLHLNPYSDAAGTLIGLERSPNSPPESGVQEHEGDLVYEAQMRSSLLGGEETFHFVLADGREKDNRIPPRGFRVAEAAARIVLPVDDGVDAPAMYTAAEYANGHDEIHLAVPPGADEIAVRLLYQTTSREYVELLRDEIAGTEGTLPAGAYVAQTDPFFAALRAWGPTIWSLWDHNKAIPGAAPIEMASAAWTEGSEIFADDFEGGSPTMWSSVTN